MRVADRLIRDLVDNYGMDVGDILVDTLTFPIATGQEETRRDGIETIEAIRQLKTMHPGVHTTLGLSNISFGLNPVARQVLNSVFLHECTEAGLDSAIVHASKILPMNRIPDEQKQAALDLVYDRREYDEAGNMTYDPLAHFLEVFADAQAQSGGQSRAEELAALPLEERLARRIIDGERNGLETDLDEAMTTRAPLEIVNDILLAGMRTVGELFGAGEMQLPFVLQSAEVMKTAVAYLEPHMEKTDDAGRARSCWPPSRATCTTSAEPGRHHLEQQRLHGGQHRHQTTGERDPGGRRAAQCRRHRHVRLLVKSTVIMKDNLAEMNARGVAEKFPVLLGGAALDPRLCGAGPGGHVRRRGALRP